MKIYKVKLTMLDNQPITERSQTHEQEGFIHPKELKEGMYLYILYDKPKGDSPGVGIAVNNLEKINDSNYKFVNAEKRVCYLTYLCEEDLDEEE